jgi:predicted transcriptional regulator
MKLEEYLKENRLTQEKFCKECGIARETLQRIMKGAIPRMEIALRIYKTTRKRVTPADLGLLP